MNIVILKGNLTRDPEVKFVNIGSKETAIATFSVAVSRFYKKQNGDTEQQTEFIDCEAWDTGAETIGKILSKGDPVLLRGSLRVDKWEKDGVKHSRTKVRVETFDKLARFSKSNDVESQQEDSVEDAVVAGVEGGDGIPF